MGTLAANSTLNQGGFTALDSKTYNYEIRGAEPPVLTKPVTVASGQVLKRMSWLESQTDGTVIAKAPLVEIASVVFADIDAAETTILAGLTWTAGASGTTAAELAAAWTDIDAGTGYADLSDRVTGGSFTAGTLTGYSTTTVNSTTVLFSASSVAAATDVADTGTGDDPTITIVQYAASNAVVGLLAVDVDATSAAVEAQAYISGNFWEEGIVWGVDTTVDTITNYQGTAVSCTTYQTGAHTSLLRQKFIEVCAGGTNIVVGGFTTGETE